MKKKITVEKDTQNNTMSFYLVIPKVGRILLTVAQFSKGVYNFFESSRSYAEVVSFKGWGRNPRLDHIINRLPGLVKYGMSELIEKNEMRQFRSKPKHRHCTDTYDYSVDAA